MASASSGAVGQRKVVMYPPQAHVFQSANVAMNDQSRPKDTTFRHYTPSQATTYASHRPSYPPSLYSLLLTHHTSTGGKLGTLLDVGCGPGNATRPLARHFERAYGVDPGREMIRVAKGLTEEALEKGEGETRGGGGIVWAEGTAEELVGPWRREGGGVDLVTASTAVCVC